MQVKALDNVDNHKLTPPYFRYLVHLIRPFPNFDFFFIRPLRQKAVRLLQLKPGERVLDVGCGPGGSLPYLVDAVGSSGEVVGVEISPEVAIKTPQPCTASAIHATVNNSAFLIYCRSWLSRGGCHEKVKRRPLGRASCSDQVASLKADKLVEADSSEQPTLEELVTLLSAEEVAA